MQIKIEDATATQLAQYATTTLGLDGIRHTMGKDAIRTKMAQAGFTGSMIEADGEKPAPAAVAAEPRKPVRILIPNQAGAGGKDHVPVGVNGRVYRIKRGEPVDVPAEVAHVLQNANVTQFELGPNNEPINPSLVPVHPFSILAA